MQNVKIAIIIPVHNEEQSIGKVITDIPQKEIFEIVVVDNASTDGTANIAKKLGATVINEQTIGYGAACLAGINYLIDKNIFVVVFLDGDYSDYPNELQNIISPILNEDYDFVLGSRVLGKREKGALPIHSRFGNLIAGTLIKLFWKVKYTDLGPFRAIKFEKLLQLKMSDEWFGWTVEMQIKAAKNNFKILEVPVSYRKRIGKSKVTGTVKGSVMAGIIILKTIFIQLFKD